ncbi:MAG: histidine phosphatase family protein [Candidatus Limnocylindrales bacterium]
MLTLVLTRHGLTPRSVPEQHLGQRIDVELSDAGRAQAQALAIRLAATRFERIVSSPLVRARQTAEIVVAGLADPAPVTTDPRLLEMDYGEWEGHTYDEIEATDRLRRHAWEADPASLRCPGGESGGDVAARARSFLDDLLVAPLDGPEPDQVGALPILAVGHSSFNRILVCVALDLPIREFRLRFLQSQVNLTVLRFEHGIGPSDARLILLNDVAHVRPATATPWE